MPIPKPKPFLSDYKTQVFIETGSHHGDGIQAALDAGFNCIYSVELSAVEFGFCQHRFRHHLDKVHLVNDDSRQFLESFLPTVTTRSTFWLDAHECGSGWGEPEDCPLWGELQIIAAHGIKQHTILIDDVRLFGTPSWPTVQAVTELIYSIGSYKINFLQSADFEQDILAATPKRL